MAESPMEALARVWPPIAQALRNVSHVTCTACGGTGTVPGADPTEPCPCRPSKPEWHATYPPSTDPEDD